jgi:hypothetical protein
MKGGKNFYKRPITSQMTTLTSSNGRGSVTREETVQGGDE